MGGANDGAAARAPALRRSLSLPLLVLYGLGTTVGAGIYALVGEVARTAGMLAFLSFAVAALLAGFSAASFAALGSRLPHAAAEAAYVRTAFRTRHGATAVGLAVVAAGSVSAATVSNGFVGYLGELVAIPRPLALLLVVAGIGVVAALGVRTSVSAAALVTAIELGGLLLVLGYAAPAFAALPARLGEFSPAHTPAGWAGILSGAYLAFYAFLGFEDMVNMSEEVPEPRRNMPLGIALTLGLTLVIYTAVALAAVLRVPPAELAASEAPLALVFARSGGDPRWLGAIGVLAMLNGALVQMIMAARILFGLARDGALPGWLSRVHPRTRTPVLATACVTAGVAALALAFPLAPLARATSLITLGIFATVNAALWRIQSRDAAPPGALVVPQAVPFAGLVVSALFLVIGLAAAFGLGGFAATSH